LHKSYVLLLISRVYELRDNLEDAIDRARESLFIAPHFLEAKYRYAVLLAKKGNKNEALSILKNLIATEPYFYVKVLIDLGLNPIKREIDVLAKEFFEHVNHNWPFCTEAGINILQAAKAEIEGGWLFTVEGQVSAEIFADFIALAKQALDDNKDVAAVLACAALEDGLKRLAIKEKLDVDDKDMSEVIKALKAKGVIKGAQAPIVQSYVKLRNKAFHAEWNKIDKESVSSVIGFTEQFLLTNFS